MLIPAVLTGIGLVLLIFGIRGRQVGSELRCRKCSYSLSGLTTLAVCPECGRDVTASKSTVRGLRRRSLIAAACGLVLLLGGGDWLRRSTYAHFVDSGWQDRVPAWWLVHIEARWATQFRLVEAIDGVRTRVARNELPASARTQLCHVLLDRLCASPPMYPVSNGERAALSAVSGWAENDDADPQHVAELILAMIFLGDDGSCSPDDPPEELTSGFLPAGWKITYTWRAVNAAGEDLGASGTSSERRINFRKLTELPPDVLAAPIRVLWKIEVHSIRLSTFVPVIREFEMPWPPPASQSPFPAR